MQAQLDIPVQSADPSNDPLVELTGIAKSFGHVEAVRGVDLCVYKGEILSLVGDNGAGKSTLVSILAGALTPDDGVIRVAGVPMQLGSIQAAEEMGIATMYQALALCPNLSAAANVFLSREISERGILGRLGFISDREMTRRTAELMDRLGIRLPAAQIDIANLSGGQKQVIAVARAMMRASRLIIMDEPTAALGARQAQVVLDAIFAARANGLSVLLVSHDLPRVLHLADRIAVMRLGGIVDIVPSRAATVPGIVARMLGETEETAQSE